MMWFAAFVIMVNGQVVSWKTPLDYFSENSCIHYMDRVVTDIHTSIKENGLQGELPYDTFGICIPIKGVSKA